jgi:hypothetical protein
MVQTCDEFYKVILNDSCLDIANNHSIPLSSFYNWNPAINDDCSGLQADEYACVGVKTAITSRGSPPHTLSRLAWFQIEANGVESGELTLLLIGVFL